MVFGVERKEGGMSRAYESRSVSVVAYEFELFMFCPDGKLEHS